jgi:hypothetical protein
MSMAAIELPPSSLRCAARSTRYVSSTLRPVVGVEMPWRLDDRNLYETVSSGCGRD